MNAPDQILFHKIQQLAPRRLAEVADFVDFLRVRDAEQGLTQGAARASVPSFAHIWDNEEDAVYDPL